MVFVCFSQDHIAAFPVAVDGNAGHAVQLPQRFRQLLLMGQAVPVEDQAHHDFPCGKSIAGQNMTHQPFARFLIIGRNMILLHKTDHPIQDLPVHRNAQRTVPVGNDLMRPPRVKSGDDMSVFIRPHRKLRLVPVVKGVLHACDGFHHLLQQFLREAADPPQVIFHFFLLEIQLFFIGKRLDLAAAALAVKSADRLHPIG